MEKRTRATMGIATFALLLVAQPSPAQIPTVAPPVPSLDARDMAVTIPGTFTLVSEARGEVAQSILQRIQRLSRDLGTDVRIEGDVGVIRVVTPASTGGEQ